MINIISIFVGDLLWAVDSERLHINDKLKTIFQVGSENQKSFAYIEINQNQNDDFSIAFHQNEYIESTQPIPVTRNQINKLHINVKIKEQSTLISAFSQLNWFSTVIHLATSFQVTNINFSISIVFLATYLTTLAQ